MELSQPAVGFNHRMVPPEKWKAYSAQVASKTTLGFQQQLSPCGCKVIKLLWQSKKGVRFFPTHTAGHTE